jgi:hypothetical protein
MAQAVPGETITKFGRKWKARNVDPTLGPPTYIVDTSRTPVSPSPSSNS